MTRKPHVGQFGTIDDTSFSSDPNALPGIPCICVKKPYTDHGETFVHVAIESEVLGADDNYYRKIFEVRVLLSRVRFQK